MKNFKHWHTLVDATTLHAALQQRATAVVVIDCRFELGQPQAGHRAWAAGHISGAHYADLEHDLSGQVTAHSSRHPLPAIDTLAATFSRWGITQDTQVVAYDASHGAMAAARLWWLLRWLGHERVAVLDGGVRAWQAAGYALSTELPAVASSHFVPLVQSPMVVSADEVKAHLHDPAWRVVDARAAERYAGSVEPIDPVSGHIPGAVNRPFNLNVDSEGRFLPAAQLRAQWQAVLNDSPAAHWISSCGSGVTGCHHLLALEVAGFTGARLYAGSWSEWCKLPGYPIATGNEP